MCDQDHDYNDEQKAFDGGKMDKFPTTVATTSGTSPTGQACSPSDVMSYYDGNTVTGLWNYAKTFAMSDNFFGTTFGPSAPGAISHGYLSPDHLPAVSFLKAPGYEDGHSGYSDPYDEQQFVTKEINALEHTPDWSSTAVIVTYDDSDGYYDHVYSGVHNPSNTSTVANPPGPQDFLTGTGLCGSGTPLAGQKGRCGYGPRLPFLVISPWARHDQATGQPLSEWSGGESGVFFRTRR